MSDAQEHYAARSRYPAPRPIVAARHLRASCTLPSTPVLCLSKSATFVALQTHLITKRAWRLRSGYTY